VASGDAKPHRSWGGDNNGQVSETTRLSNGGRHVVDIKRRGGLMDTVRTWEKWGGSIRRTMAPVFRTHAQLKAIDSCSGNLFLEIAVTCQGDEHICREKLEPVTP